MGKAKVNYRVVKCDYDAYTIERKFLWFWVRIRKIIPTYDVESLYAYINKQK